MEKMYLQANYFVTTNFASAISLLRLHCSNNQTVAKNGFTQHKIQLL